MSVVHVFLEAVQVAGRDPSMAGPYMAGSRLAWAAARALGAQGAGIAVWSGDTLGLPWGASSADAAMAEQAQATWGRGPCVEAFTDGQPWMDDDGGDPQWFAVIPDVVGMTVARAVIVARNQVFDVFGPNPERLISEGRSGSHDQGDRAGSGAGQRASPRQQRHRHPDRRRRRSRRT